MKKVKCNNCNYKFKKLTLESLIYAIKKADDNTISETHPRCKENIFKIKSSEREMAK